MNIIINSVNYTIIDEIGDNKKDGIKVYKVVNKINNQNFVIKELSIQNNNKEEINEIKKEAEFLSCFSCDNIVKYFGYEHNEDKFQILMEYCDEKDLKTFINLYKDKDEYINENIIYTIIKQICFGIKEIHDKNIVHRDLKPQNIFMCKGQKIKIGDFGISKQLFYSQNYKSTKISAGTYGYVAPEIIQNRKYNKKSDIWSFGCIVYELFHLSEHYLDIYNGVKKIDKEIYNEKWQVLIDLLLEFNPDKRPDINQIIEFIHKNFDIIIFKSIKYEIQKELKNDIKKGIKVYQVINQKDNNIYIIKELNIKNDDKNYIKQISKKIIHLIKSRCDYIFHYYDVNYNKNIFQILMEYYYGEDLRTYIDHYKKKHKHIKEKILCDIIKQMCLGIKFLNEKNIILNYLKSKNIFINEEKKIKMDILENLIIKINNDEQKNEIPTNKINIKLLGTIFNELFSFQKYHFGDKITNINIDINIYNNKWYKIIKSILQNDPLYIPGIDELINDIDEIKKIQIIKEEKKEKEKIQNLEKERQEKENKINEIKEENKIDNEKLNEINNTIPSENLMDLTGIPNIVEEVHFDRNINFEKIMGK